MSDLTLTEQDIAAAEEIQARCASLFLLVCGEMMKEGVDEKHILAALLNTAVARSTVVFGASGTVDWLRALADELDKGVN